VIVAGCGAIIAGRGGDRRRLRAIIAAGNEGDRPRRITRSPLPGHILMVCAATISPIAPSGRWSC
jgi:hypothetical protein